MQLKTDLKQLNIYSWITKQPNLCTFKSILLSVKYGQQPTDIHKTPQLCIQVIKYIFESLSIK